MRRMLAATVWAVTMVTGCTLPPPDDLGDGPALPAGVGQIGGVCTAALVAPSRIVTTRRCLGTSAQFELGPTAVSIDTWDPHPTKDLVVGHLAAPIRNTPVVRLGALPTAGTACTGAGGLVLCGGALTGTGDDDTDTVTPIDAAWLRAAIGS